MQQAFISSTLAGFTRVLGRALTAEHIARQRGLLQSLDPRARLAGILVLVLAVTLAHRLAAIAALLILAVALALLSRVSLATLARRVWLVVLAFTGVIALPALFLTPGNPLIIAGRTSAITDGGLHTALRLIMRVETAVTLTTVLVLCTPWPHVLKALRAFRVPREVVMMLAMAHRYIFLLVETANQMFEARQSRTVGTLTGAARRQVAARTAGVLMSKSMGLSEEVFLAMQSRGYRGEVRIIDEFRMRSRDVAFLCVAVASAAVAAWLGW